MACSGFFVWLSPGPDMDAARGLLDQAGFSRVRWTGYPTLCRERHYVAAFISRPISTSARWPRTTSRHAAKHLGETLWPEYADARRARTASSTTWRSTARRPVAIAALCSLRRHRLSDGRGHRRSRPQARRAAGPDRQAAVARAEQLGCAILVSETLYMLEHSYRNLQRAGFRRGLREEKSTNGMR